VGLESLGKSLAVYGVMGGRGTSRVEFGERKVLKTVWHMGGAG